MKSELLAIIHTESLKSIGAKPFNVIKRRVRFLDDGCSLLVNGKVQVVSGGMEDLL